MSMLSNLMRLRRAPRGVMRGSWSRLWPVAALLALLVLPATAQQTDDEPSAAEPATADSTAVEPGDDMLSAEEAELAGRPGPSFDLGWAESGLSFGNSPRWTGLRFNLSDDGIESIHGLNLTLWAPGSTRDSEVSGLAIGLMGPAATRFDGLGVGLIAVQTHEEANGFEIAGIAAVNEGTLDGLCAALVATLARRGWTGINLAGIASISEGPTDGIGLAGVASLSGDRTGVSVSGVAQVSDGDAAGLQLAGVVTVTERDAEGLRVAGIANLARGSFIGLGVAGLAQITTGPATGIELAGLATLTEGDRRGLHVGGLATVAQGSAEGLSIAGLANVTGRGSQGLGVGGLFVHSGGPIEGLHIAGLGLSSQASSEDDQLYQSFLGDVSTGSILGLGATLYRTKAHALEGVFVSGVLNSAHDLEGLAVGAANVVQGHQTGLSVGLFNSADSLRGVQIGLLNHVPSNPTWARWLPLVNARFGD